jgi:hypothetical protein
LNRKINSGGKLSVLIHAEQQLANDPPPKKREQEYHKIINREEHQFEIVQDANRGEGRRQKRMEE